MNKSVKKVIHFLYGPFIAVIYFFMTNYRANRDRLERLFANKKVSGFLKGLAVVVLIAWLGTFYFAPEESRDRLTDQIKSVFAK